MTDEPNGRELAPAGRPQLDPLLQMIARASRDPKVDVEKLERMMAMLERREDKAKEMEFNAAMAAAKGDFETIVKNRLVAFEGRSGKTSYRYEDLASVLDAVEPALKANGLNVRFTAEQPAPGKLKVTCIITHSGGHKEMTSLEAGDDTSGQKNPHQAVGSAVTYLQRYTVKLALGLAASMDDDGRGGNGGDAPSAALIDANQLAHLTQLMADAGRTREQIQNGMGVAALEQMTVPVYIRTVGYLNQAIAKLRRDADADATSGETDR
jgi:ERF superfamily protein